MDQNGIQAIQQLATALNKAALTDKELQTKEREKFFNQVNYSETKKTLDELRIPRELRYHIPREPADYKRLSEQARKARRSNFKVPKCFPAAATFRTGNKNKKLDKAIKNLAQHFQSNSKNNLGASIEIATKLASTGALLRRRIQEHTQLPGLLQLGRQRGLDLNAPENLHYITRRLTEEFALYRSILEELQEAFDRLLDLIFLQGDAAADGIEQIKNICLAIKNLKSRKENVLPTKEDYRDAQGGYYGGGRGRRGGGFNRRPWHRGGRHGGRGFGRGDRGPPYNSNYNPYYGGYGGYGNGGQQGGYNTSNGRQ